MKFSIAFLPSLAWYLMSMASSQISGHFSISVGLLDLATSGESLSPMIPTYGERCPLYSHKLQHSMAVVWSSGPATLAPLAVSKLHLFPSATKVIRQFGGLAVYDLRQAVLSVIRDNSISASLSG
jgi:hypothetical protein